jgi:hypothetical protein
MFVDLHHAELPAHLRLAALRDVRPFAGANRLRQWLPLRIWRSRDAAQGVSMVGLSG